MATEGAKAREQPASPAQRSCGRRRPRGVHCEERELTHLPQSVWRRDGRGYPCSLAHGRRKRRNHAQSRLLRLLQLLRRLQLLKLRLLLLDLLLLPLRLLLLLLYLLSLLLLLLYLLYLLLLPAARSVGG